MRLIDADRLQKTIAIVQADNDRPPSPYLEYGTMYFYEISDMVDDEPTVDPVHAAGGCYCRECRYCGVPVFTEGVLLCRRGNRPERKNRDDFCSRGKLKEEK